MTPDKLDKVLRRARKLHERAASDTKGDEESVKNAAALLQELLIKYKLSHADVAAAAHEGEDEEISEHPIRWSKHGFEPKRRRRLWMEQLADIVTRAHGCRFLVTVGSDRITLVGRPSNVQIAEFVLVTLRRAVERISWNKYCAFWEKCDKEGDRAKARGYQASFINGFLERIRERFDEELNKDRGEGCTALVLFEDEVKAVQHWMRSRPYGKAERISGSRGMNIAGHRHGRDFAQGMDIRGNAVKGGSSNGRQIQ